MFGGGGLVEFRAALLASKGFAVFALSYFGYDDLPNSVSDLDVDYFLVSLYILKLICIVAILLML